MSDSERYFSLAEATFAAYFVLAPLNDVCSVDAYFLKSALSPETAWSNTDTRVALSGSLGSYVVKLDKSVATNGLTFYLKAQTKGLVASSKHIYYSVCPPTGGSLVTPPAGSLTYSVNVGSTGTAANANFGEWTIVD
jgi:hypothetical protein